MKHPSNLVAAVVLWAGACAAPAQAQNVKEQIAGLKAQNESQKAEIERIRKELPILEKEAAGRKIEFDRHAALTQELETARTTAKSLEDDLRRKDGLLKHFSQNFKEQVRIPAGSAYESLKLKSGREFKGVKYMGVNGRAIKLQHAEGIASVPFEDLPPELSSQIVAKPVLPDLPLLSIVLAARPAELSRLKLFAATAMAEAKEAITAQNEAFVREREESERKVNAEREARSQVIDTERMANVEINKKLDADIASAEKLIAGNEAAMRAAEAQFAAETAKPIKTEKEEREREEYIFRHNDQMDKLRNNISELRSRIVNLMQQKKSER